MSCNSSDSLTIIVPSVPDITIMVPAPSIILTAQPQGPIGPEGAPIIASAGPPTPPGAGWRFYYDTLDGNWLKVIYANGNIYSMFPASES